MKNWIVVPVHNGLPYTRLAVPTFLNQDIGEVGVLVVNNASTDGTAQWLAAQPENVLAIHRTQPGSVASSWNEALQWVFSGGAEYALVVNNDVELMADTYRLLAASGEEFITGVSVRQRSQLSTDRTGEKRLHPDFSCFLIRQSVYETVGPFDERFLIGWAEDCDYHVRMHRAGISAYCTDVPFLHHSSGTLKSVPEIEARRMREQAEKNRAYFKEKWGVAIGTPEYDTLFEPQCVV
jgi:GT2 family glycosyltransferase